VVPNPHGALQRTRLRNEVELGTGTCDTVEDRLSRRDLVRLMCSSVVLCASDRVGMNHPFADMGQGAHVDMGLDAQDTALRWHPNLFPEMIVKAWYQEDLPEGKIASWQSSGVKPAAATQSVQSWCPTKLANGGGVLFKKGTMQALTWGADPDAPYLHRWWLVIARCDFSDSTSQSEVSVLSVNGDGSGPTYRQPRVFLGMSRSLLKMERSGVARLEPLGSGC
jgi:hypothetical protein